MHRKIFILTVLSASFFACNRTDRSVSTGTAGKGGNALLKITPQHHGKYIDSCTIYIKYNSQDVPLSFDDSAICVQENNKPVATFTQLKKGSYYIFGKGWEPDILQNVKGGLPYILTEEKSIELVVPVTEVH